MKARILIVEDEPAIVDNLEYALQTEGFATMSRATGGGVPSLLESERIDLIILDIGLPDVNGLELCKTIRQHHSVPVIFLTARAEEVDRVVGLEIGADDYVVKPFSPRELCARVKAVLRRTRCAPSATASAPPLEVVDHKHCVRCFGQPLELSRYEYALLKILVEHPGQVFSREHLMDRVWDDPLASMDRTVDAHIKNIRKKIKAVQPEFDPIVTHRGIGYALKENP
ncbi:MAG: two-component system response regulator CreB [Desulfobacterales bacterium]|nr:two-component system response regulator CreB [Desulfobacterales bacterium]